MTVPKRGYAHKLAISALGNKKVEDHLDTRIEDLPVDLRMAFRHYLSKDKTSDSFYCQGCAESTLADLMFRKISCQEALSLHTALSTICKEAISRSWPGEHVETIGQLAAIEHIWGQPSLQEAAPPYSNFCQEEACRKLRSFRREMAMKDMEEYEEVLYLLDLFLARDWPIERVFDSLCDHLLDFFENEKKKANVRERRKIQDILQRLGFLAGVQLG